MSSIDLSNPKVLQAFLLAQMKEGKGTFEVKQNVVVFRDAVGNEFVAPPDLARKQHPELFEVKEEIKVEETKVEPLPEETEKVVGASKKKSKS